MKKIILLLVFLPFLACGVDEGPQVGKNGILDSGGPWAPVAISEGAFSEWRKAKIANDDRGQVLLIASGKILTVKSGTPILVIDTGMAIRKVRILEGDFADASGWVYVEHIK